jgi:solute carrier family 25 citrate transporter 1
MDSIKTRLQLDTKGQYRGMLNCARSMVKQEGAGALWKGLTPYSAHLVLKHTLRMGSNALLQSAFRDPETGDLGNSHRIAAGFGAGVLEALLVVTPCEV